MTKDLIERLNHGLSLIMADSHSGDDFDQFISDVQTLLSTQTGETGLVGWVTVPRGILQDLVSVFYGFEGPMEADRMEQWAGATREVRRALSAPTPSPDPEQAPTRPSVEGERCPSCDGLNTSCPEGCGRDPRTGELDGSTLPASDGSGDLVDPLEKLRALRRLCDASSQPFYVEIIDEVFAALATPTTRDQALEEAARVAEKAATEAGRGGMLHPEDSESRGRLFARQREASAIATAIRALQPQSPSLMGSVEGVRDQALEEALGWCIGQAEGIMSIAAGCATTHGDPGGGLEQISGIASDIAINLQMTADSLRSSPSSPTIAPPDPVARQMAEALRPFQREAKRLGLTPDQDIYSFAHSGLSNGDLRAAAEAFAAFEGAGE